MSDTYSNLAERIAGERRDLQRTIDRVARAWNEARRHPKEEDLLLDAVALNLHAFYSGIESVFEHIGRFVDGNIPEGQTWHRQLLTQMANEVPGVRPAVISVNVANKLDEYRRFRHLVRNVYAINLLPDRLENLVAQLPDTLGFSSMPKLRLSPIFLQSSNGTRAKMAEYQANLRPGRDGLYERLKGHGVFGRRYFYSLDQLVLNVPAPA